MAEVTAQLVKQLREMTAAGFSDCKKALDETQGDLDKAVEFLQKKSASIAVKKSGRTAAEGRVNVFVSADSRTGVLLELNCETDFVGKNTDFQALLKDLCEHVALRGTPSVDALVDEPFFKDASKTCKQVVSETVQKTGENIVARRFVRFSAGYITYYVHHDGKSAVLLEMGTEIPNAAANEDFVQLGKDLCMQATAMSPTYLKREEVSADTIAHQREIFMAQAKETGKPDAMLARIADGKLSKWYGEICLLEQMFVKDPDGKKTCAQIVADVANKAGGGITVQRFVRYEVGEGIEKRKDDFASEVAAMTGHG